MNFARTFIAAALLVASPGIGSAAVAQNYPQRDQNGQNGPATPGSSSHAPQDQGNQRAGTGNADGRGYDGGQQGSDGQRQDGGDRRDQGGGYGDHGRGDGRRYAGGNGGGYGSGYGHHRHRHCVTQMHHHHRVTRCY